MSEDPGAENPRSADEHPDHGDAGPVSGQDIGRIPGPATGPDTRPDTVPDAGPDAGHVSEEPTPSNTHQDAHRPQGWRRLFSGRRMVQVLLVGAIVYLAIPLVGEADQVLHALTRANPWWMLASLGFVFLGSVCAALGMRACAGVAAPFWSAVELQIAANFVGTATPASVGSVAIAVRYLHRKGQPLPLATAAIGLQSAVQFLVHIVLLALLVVFGGGSVDLLRGVPDAHVVLAISGIVLVLVAVALGVPQLRNALTRAWHDQGREIVTNLTTLVRTPRRLGAAVLGAAGTTLSGAAALWAVILAVSGGNHPVVAAFTTMVGETLATAAPTPGGIGAVEAALVASMTAFGLTPGIALAAAFGYRITSTWIPVLAGWLFYNHLQRHDDI